MQKNRLCQMLGIDFPIIQGGMVWVSNHRLVGACSKAGILGTLGAGSMTPELLATNISAMQDKTDRPFAVNIPLLRPGAEELARLALDMGVTIFITAAGNPAKIVPLLRRPGNVLLHVVPSVKGAKKAEDLGVDAVICEGYEAGGHNSPFETTTLCLTPQIADAVNIPVVAAGGIADGRGLCAAMALGASGIQMGTRLLATVECQAHDEYKTAITKAVDMGTIIIGRKLGMLRALVSPFAEKVVKAEAQGADKEALLNLVGTEINRNKAASLDGDWDQGVFQAGQSSGLISDIPTVAQLVDRLVEEYEQARRGLGPLGGSG